MKNFLLIFNVFAFAVIPMKSFGHEKWANGDPVPTWVKASCCGPSDIHHLEPEQVHVVPGGFRVDGYNEIIPQNKTSISPDNNWWIFYKTYSNGSQSPIYCFFIPGFGT